MNDNNIILFFKFGEHRWMQKLVEGNINFSCAGNFIFQAKHTDNDVQGDRFEGVFARLSADDVRIEEMKNLLGKDLEIIDDGAFKLLRRKSAKMKPIFCLYGYKAGDVLNDCESPTIGMNTIRHTFHNEMYYGFSNSFSAPNVISNSHRFAQVTFTKSDDFIKRLRVSLFAQNIAYKMDNVNYSEFEKETFFIPPTDSYNELFYKFPKYKHQHESRICLKKMSFGNIFERYNLFVGEFSQDEYVITDTPFYLTTEVILKRKSNSL